MSRKKLQSNEFIRIIIIIIIPTILMHMMYIVMRSVVNVVLIYVVLYVMQFLDVRRVVKHYVEAQKQLSEMRVVLFLHYSQDYGKFWVLSVKFVWIYVVPVFEIKNIEILQQNTKYNIKKFRYKVFYLFIIFKINNFT